MTKSDYEEEIVDFHFTEDLFDIIEPIVRQKMLTDNWWKEHNPYPRMMRLTERLP